MSTPTGGARSCASSPDASAPDTFSVAIAGAGLSGLCLAQALRQAGFDVHVYERDPTPHARRQGYRITLDNHGMSALERCLPQDLFRRFLRIFPLPRGVGHFRFTNQDLGEIFKLTFRPDSGGDFGRAAVRASAGAGEAMLHFADGSSIGASVVVGADGARSALRKHLLPECDPIDLGSAGINGRSALVRDGHSIVPEPLENSGLLALGAPGRGFFFTTRFGDQSPKTM